MSPSVELGGHGIRHNDFPYMGNNSLPVHLRNDLHVASPTSTSSLNMRPTSHPTGYGPPPTLEPSIESHPPGPGSSCGSPHMGSVGSVGWQSPTHAPSPTHSTSYMYPDPDPYPQPHGLGQMYHYGPAGHIRRPQSTEPGLMHMA